MFENLCHNFEDILPLKLISQFVRSQLRRFLVIKDDIPLLEKGR